MTQHSLLRIAAISGATAVILGAFGAHGLKPHFSEYQMDIYEKAVHYQFFHTLVMALTAVLPATSLRVNSRRLRAAAWCFFAGILLFSGSLYLLACRDLLSFPVAWVGPITPLGGLGFIAGWVLTAFSIQSANR